MARGFQDIRRIDETVDFKQVDDTAITPVVINATDVEDFEDFSSDPISGFIIENDGGPNSVKIRISGTAGLADGEFSFTIPKNEGRSLSDVIITKISAICASSETAKIVIQPLRKP